MKYYYIAYAYSSECGLSVSSCYYKLYDDGIFCPSEIVKEIKTKGGFSSVVILGVQEISVLAYNKGLEAQE